MHPRLSQVVILGLALLPVTVACTSRTVAESPAVSASAPGTSTRPGAFGNFDSVHRPSSPAEVARVLELDVAYETMHCDETRQEQCLQIRRDPNGPWELCYDDIAGFDHDHGYRYHLRVEHIPGQNPGADASSWRLLEILDKQRVIPDPIQPPDNTGLNGPGLSGG